MDLADRLVAVFSPNKNSGLGSLLVVTIELTNASRSLPTQFNDAEALVSGNGPLSSLLQEVKAACVNGQGSSVQQWEKLKSFSDTHQIFMSMLAASAKDYASPQNEEDKERLARTTGFKFDRHSQVWAKLLMTTASKHEDSVKKLDEKCSELERKIAERSGAGLDDRLQVLLKGIKNGCGLLVSAFKVFHDVWKNVFSTTRYMNGMDDIRLALGEHLLSSEEELHKFKGVAQELNRACTDYLDELRKQGIKVPEDVEESE